MCPIGVCAVYVQTVNANADSKRCDAYGGVFFDTTIHF